MVLPISEVRRIVERVCARQDVLDACAERDIGYVIAVLEENGLTQSQIAERLNLPLGTVKTRSFHGMRALRSALIERGFHGV